MLSALLREQQRHAEATLPPVVQAYYAGGSGEEITLAEAAAAWRAYRLRPHVLRDVATVDTAVTVLGSRLAVPVLAGPSASQALAHPDGEAATAAGAVAAGSLMVLSSRSSTRIEKVAATAAAAGGDWWFQSYVMRDRGITRDLVSRAAANGAKAIVLTGDTPVVGTKLRQGVDNLGVTDEITGINVDQPSPAGMSLLEAIGQDPATTLADIGWLAALSGLPVLVKGVLRGDDALECVAAGASGIVVSTHGGRQLDRVVASARALPEVVDAVAGRVPVLVDGGITSAHDLLVALALGASAVLVGRPVLWALATDGAAGVTALLDGFRVDLVEALQLAGCRSAADVPRDLVAQGYWPGIVA